MSIASRDVLGKRQFCSVAFMKAQMEAKEAGKGARKVRAAWLLSMVLNAFPPRVCVWALSPD